MILVRDQFQTRYGRVEELLALFRRFRGMYAGEKTFQGVRVLTDALAPLNTVTTEYIVESVNAYYDWARERYPSTEFKVWFNQMLACTDSGVREFYEFVTPYQDLRGTPGRGSFRMCRP